MSVALLLFTVPSVASSPVDVDPQAVRSRGRIQLSVPSFDIGAAALSRAGTGFGVAFELGMEPFRAGRWGVRAGLHAAGSRRLHDLEAVGEPGFIQRSLTTTGFDIAPRFTVVDGLDLEVVAGLTWHAYRQQWTTVQTAVVPRTGLGIEGQWSWVGTRVRGLVDTRRIELFAPDGSSRGLTPVEVGVSMFVRVRPRTSREPASQQANGSAFQEIRESGDPNRAQRTL